MPEVKCDKCASDAIHAYCDGCMDEKLEKEYERGVADGKEAAEEKEELIEE